MTTPTRAKAAFNPTPGSWLRPRPPAAPAAPGIPGVPAAHPHDAVTGRAMDTLLSLVLLSGAGAAAARTGSELFDRFAVSRMRNKIRGGNVLGLGSGVPRVTVMPLPYVKGGADPGDSPGGGLTPRPRGRAARLGRNIDPAANMRALNAKPLPTDPNLAAMQRAQAIQANLAKTRANRALPGYRSSFAHTNVNPLGQVASNVATAPPAVSAGLPPVARRPRYVAPPAAQAARPRPPVGSFPSPVGPGGAASSLALAGRTVVQPPTGGVVPKGGDLAGVQDRDGLKAAAELAPPSGLAQQLVRHLGLARTGAPPSVARDFLNPADATTLGSMPWLWGAAVPAMALGAYAGYRPLDAAFKALRKSDDRAEFDEIKRRYHDALRAGALAKSGSADLDGAYEQFAKDASWTSIPMGALAALFGTGLTAGAYHGWTTEQDVNSKAILTAALKKRHAELAAKLPRLYAVRPEAVSPRTQQRASRMLMQTPDEDVDF